MGNQQANGLLNQATCDLLTDEERCQRKRRGAAVGTCSRFCGEDGDEDGGCCGDPCGTSGVGGGLGSTSGVEVRVRPEGTVLPVNAEVSHAVDPNSFAEDLLEHQRSNTAWGIHDSDAAVQASPAKIGLLGSPQKVKGSPGNNIQITGLGGLDCMDMKPDEAKLRLEHIVTEWKRKLLAGLVVSLDREPVTLAYDPDLQGLEVREHGSLHPLAVLTECRFTCDSPTGPDDAGEKFYSVAVIFEGELDELVFQFDEEADRVAFALTLQVLANEARDEKESCATTERPQEQAGTWQEEEESEDSY